MPTIVIIIITYMAMAITIITTVLIGVYPEKLIELCKFIAYNI